MDERLVEAARVGDVIALHRIIEEDPQVLEKASLALSADSPLHVAALSGRVNFVKQMISHMPSLAMHTNQEGLIPLHMASAQGHVETVRELLKAKLDDEDEEVMTNLCLVKDNEGRTPLHYAVCRGRVGVIKELMSYSPECVEEVTAKGETVLHLAVKANQLKVVEVIVESIKRLPNLQTLLKAKDINGKTVYDLAAAKKNFLLRLEKGKEEDNDEIKEETDITVEVEEGGSDRCDEKPENKQKQKVQEPVLIVATLIITLTYQGLTNPPSTLFQTGSKIDWSCLFVEQSSPKYILYPTVNIDKRCPAILSLLFLVTNSIIFFQSIVLLFWSLRGAHGSLLILKTLSWLLIYTYCVLLEAFTFYAAYVTAVIVWLSAIFLPYLLVREPWIQRNLRLIWKNRCWHCVSQLTKCIQC